MTDSITTNPFDEYQKSVVVGLGFPNHYELTGDATQQPTGWHGLDRKDVTNVSRETSSEVVDARRAQL